MISRSADCRLLRPSLVSFVYGESHPEEERLRAHLRICSRCRREERELREVRQMLESSSTQLAAEPRLPLWKRLPALSAAVPLVLVVYLVFQEEVRLLSPEAPAQPALSVLAAPPAGALAAFVGEELDRRLEVLEFEVDELSGLKRDAW